jgi:hypothetical protein
MWRGDHGKTVCSLRSGRSVNLGSWLFTGALATVPVAALLCARHRAYGAYLAWIATLTLLLMVFALTILPPHHSTIESVLITALIYLPLEVCPDTRRLRPTRGYVTVRAGHDSRGICSGRPLLVRLRHRYFLLCGARLPVSVGKRLTSVGVASVPETECGASTDNCLVLVSDREPWRPAGQRNRRRTKRS